MRKLVWIIVVAVGGLLLLLVGGGFLLLQASRQVPEFYREALKIEPARQQQASDEMLQQATALASDVKKEGQWQALFTAEQINGWLAVDLMKNHPRALPRGVSDPRVAVDPHRLTLACRIRRRGFDGVVTLIVDAYLPEPNVVAIRIHKVRAGLVPLPMDRILDRIGKAARRRDLRIEWRQVDGDPVALVSIPPPRDENGRVVRVEVLQLGKGEIFVSGSTEKEKAFADDGADQSATHPVPRGTMGNRVGTPDF